MTIFLLSSNCSHSIPSVQSAYYLNWYFAILLVNFRYCKYLENITILNLSKFDPPILLFEAVIGLVSYRNIVILYLNVFYATNLTVFGMHSLLTLVTIR